MSSKVSRYSGIKCWGIRHTIWPRFWPLPRISVRTLRNTTMYEPMSIITVLYCFTQLSVHYLWFFVCFLAQLCECVSMQHYRESELYMCWTAEVCSCTCDGEILCQCGFIHIFWINVGLRYSSLLYVYVWVCVSFRLSGAVGGHRSDSARQAEQIINRDGRRETGCVQNGTLAYCLLHSIQLIYIFFNIIWNGTQR